MSSIGNRIFRVRVSLNLECTVSARPTGQLVVEILPLPPYPALECGVCCHALLGTSVLGLIVKSSVLAGLSTEPSPQHLSAPFLELISQV